MPNELGSIWIFFFGTVTRDVPQLESNTKETSLSNHSATSLGQEILGVIEVWTYFTVYNLRNQPHLPIRGVDTRPDGIHDLNL